MATARLVTAGTAAALLLRPRLWGEAVRAIGRLARRGWWRRWPPVPLPDPAYVEWRRQTAHGPEGAGGDMVHDLISWLEFCRALRRSAP